MKEVEEVIVFIDGRPVKRKVILSGKFKISVVDEGLGKKTFTREYYEDAVELVQRLLKGEEIW